jgi:hypothetical protein
MLTRVVVFAIALLASACGDRTSIQTGEVGKTLGTQGLEKGVRGPGTFRMDYCGWGACPKLVRLQVNKSTSDFTIDSLFLPKSNVDIRNVRVGLQFQVKSDEASIDKVFQEVRPIAAEHQGDETNRVMIITAEMVYETFLRRKAPDAIVTALREHTVDEVLTNVPEIAEHTKDKINLMLADAPIEVTELGFPNGIGEVPKEVIEAKRRLFAIDEDRARKIRSLEADLVIEDQRQAVQRKRLDHDLVNARAAGVDYSLYVWLKTQERFADAAEAGTPIALGAQLMPSSPAKGGG